MYFFGIGVMVVKIRLLVTTNLGKIALEKFKDTLKGMFGQVANKRMNTLVIMQNDLKMLEIVMKVGW